MNQRHTAIRTLHDIGAAAWMGGSLMGAVGLNGASQTVTDTTERARVASDGWARWAPVSAAAIAAHVAGGLGLLIANRDRVRNQSGVTANTVVKTVATVAALGTTAYSGLLGARIARAGDVPAESGTVPAPETPNQTAATQQQLRVLQWITPALVALIVGLGAQQGEQQRPGPRWRGIAAKATPRANNR